MAVVYRTPAADADLRNIAYAIGVESGRPLTAEKNVRELVACMERLAQLSSTAKLGSREPSLGHGVRLFTHKRWVIIFRYIEAGVLVLRIADGSQDYSSWTLE